MRERAWAERSLAREARLRSESRGEGGWVGRLRSLLGRS